MHQRVFIFMKNPIRPLLFDEADKLGIDEENNLYWDNKQIQTKTIISLEGCTFLLALVATIAASVDAFCNLNTIFHWLKG